MVLNYIGLNMGMRPASGNTMALPSLL